MILSSRNLPQHHALANGLLLIKNPVNGLARYMDLQLFTDFWSDRCRALDKKDNILQASSMVSLRSWDQTVKSVKGAIPPGVDIGEGIDEIL